VLTVKARGFTTEVRELTLKVNQRLRADVSLKVGEVTQRVEVVSSVQICGGFTPSTNARGHCRSISPFSPEVGPKVRTFIISPASSY
jgi:hypothetical protein